MMMNINQKIKILNTDRLADIILGRQVNSNKEAICNRMIIIPIKLNSSDQISFWIAIVFYFQFLASHDTEEK